jgi:hypothetical protein
MKLSIMQTFEINMPTMGLTIKKIYFHLNSQLLRFLFPFSLTFHNNCVKNEGRIMYIVGVGRSEELAQIRERMHSITTHLLDLTSQLN